jgi:hypothetical protein
VRQSDVTTDRFAERLVANLQGFCQFRKQGCQWVGARGDMSGHCARECQFVTVCCPNTGCDKELLRRDLWKHSEHECAYSCQACEVELECPFGCGHACVEGELEPHKEQCLMEPRKLLAALKHLHLENQRLSAENENLRDEVSSCPPSVRPPRRPPLAPDLIHKLPLWPPAAAHAAQGEPTAHRPGHVHRLVPPQLLLQARPRWSPAGGCLLASTCPRRRGKGGAGAQTPR